MPLHMTAGTDAGAFQWINDAPQSSLRPRLSLHGEPDEAHTNRIDPDD